MERTIVVGDVHGCAAELEALLAACGWQPGDRLVLAGDLVAKGPDSQAVVQLARERDALGVLGNHDENLLKTRDLLEGRGGTTGEPISVRPEREKLVKSLSAADWEYLDRLPLLLRLGPERAGEADTVVLHAGAVVGVPLEAQRRQDLTCLRSITATGKPSKRLDGEPWAALWTGPERIVFGHDAVRGLQQHPFATGLDSGCVYGGRLTALLLPERRLVSVPARRAYAD
jgi:hypothetical protein